MHLLLVFLDIDLLVEELLQLKNKYSSRCNMKYNSD